MLNQLVRYAAVVPLVRELGPGTVLDVGSGSRGIAPWLGPGWEVTAVDADFSDYGSAEGPQAGTAQRQVVGDARALPFADGAFDAVVALDLLEHIDPGDRPAVLGEIGRVARRRAIVGCPAGTAALEADRRLLEHYRARGGAVPGWLVEHVDHGFPDPGELRRGLEGAGSVRLLGNESIPAHERLMRAEAGPATLRASSLLDVPLRWGVRRGGGAGRVADRLVSALRGGDRAPTYRTIAVLDR